MKEGKILIVDDNKGLLNALQILLQSAFEEIKLISGTQMLMNSLEKTDFDIVMLDMNFKSGVNTGNEGLFWLKEIKKAYPFIEVVMITAYGDIELAVKALKEGASDFVLKPWDNEKLLATLKTAFRLRKSYREINNLRSKQIMLKNDASRNSSIIYGQSVAMKNVMQVVAKIAGTEANVLITGENGTGKELIAREIHHLSQRNNEMFVLVDLSSLTETLFESELFGHKKGAFTNAFEDRTGRFMLADKGTLFLDEIGNIPIHLQSKLLTVLQTRMVAPVGSTIEKPIDIRLISATNKNLAQLVSTNQFRQDLLYRMNTIQIHLPPLRERIEDIENLALYYLEIYSKKYGKSGIILSDEAISRLKGYYWPGNIRELQHAVEKAVILSETGKLRGTDFFFGANETLSVNQVETLEEMEKRMIINALRRNDQNQSATALQLGITRQTLYNKIKKYGI